MAASATDYFVKVGDPGTATTLSAPGHLIGGTSITVGSTSNYPTTTGVIFAIDTVTIVNGEEVRNVGSYTEWEGTVGGATTLENMVLRYGTDQNYSAGATTRVYIPVASSRENRLVDGLLVSHDQDGTLKADAVDNTAAIKNGIITNAKLSTTAGEIGGAWSTYTVSTTNMTIGSGTLAGYYTQIGKNVFFRIYFKFAADSAITNSYPTFSLPIAARTLSDTYFLAGTADGIYLDSGTAVYYGKTYITSGATSMSAQVANVASTYPSEFGVSSTSPFTWTTNDIISFAGGYEV